MYLIKQKHLSFDNCTKAYQDLSFVALAKPKNVRKVKEDISESEQ